MGIDMGEGVWDAGEWGQGGAERKMVHRGRMEPVGDIRWVKARVELDKSAEKDTTIGRACVGVPGFL